ncbi:MAG: 16S rRNA (cytosine(1402)-N(4))-methyltransferase RsmH, partial [Ilumatobacteraceae bacterium]
MSVADDFEHQPVMRDEIVDVFSTVPPGVVLDATLGGGGHTEAILESRADLRVLGIDRDHTALKAAGARLERFGERFTSAHARFDALREVMDDHEVAELSGALFDLGVSSHQLDTADRGFSYRHEGPVDMRMDSSGEWSADDVVNGYDEDRLADIIERHGDERFARRIARAIVVARPIERTTDLAEVVTAAI